LYIFWFFREWLLDALLSWGILPATHNQSQTSWL
jgi:hypothetical protein